MSSTYGTRSCCIGGFFICSFRSYFIKYTTGMLYAIVLYVVCPSVRLSVFTINLRTIRRRMMKLCTYIIEVKSNMEFDDGSRTLPLTWSNWRFSEWAFSVHVRLHSVHVHTYPFLWNTCIYLCATPVIFSLLRLAAWENEAKKK